MSKTATSRPGLVPRAAAVAAPDWTVESWLNHDGPLSLHDLRGRVVVLHAFQMLCPGCVAHGIPQAQRIRAAFAGEDVAVIGLHSVFEHHEAMSPVSLRAFVHEYRVEFPVGVDAPGTDAPIPQTMRAYAMRGTPTLVLIDGEGRLRLHVFGRPEDMMVGAAVATLIGEGDGRQPGFFEEPGAADNASCDAGGCSVGTAPAVSLTR